MKSESPTCNAVHDVVPKSEVRAQDGAELVLRIGVDGVRSLELLASESDQEARLRGLWNALRPIIEEFFAAVRS